MCLRARWSSYRAIVEHDLMEHRAVASATAAAIDNWLAARPADAGAPHLVDLGCGDLALLAPLLQRLPLATWLWGRRGAWCCSGQAWKKKRREGQSLALSLRLSQTRWKADLQSVTSLRKEEVFLACSSLLAPATRAVLRWRRVGALRAVGRAFEGGIHFLSGVPRTGNLLFDKPFDV